MISNKVLLIGGFIFSFIIFVIGIILLVISKSRKEVFSAIEVILLAVLYIPGCILAVILPIIGIAALILAPFYLLYLLVIRVKKL